MKKVAVQSRLEEGRGKVEDGKVLTQTILRTAVVALINTNLN